jgi:hypothetical protein
MTTALAGSRQTDEMPVEGDEMVDCKWKGTTRPGKVDVRARGPPEAVNLISLTLSRKSVDVESSTLIRTPPYICEN